MKIFNIIAVALCATVIFYLPVQAKQNDSKKIIYIPHDNRPIVDEETIEVAQSAGYKIIVPPKEFLGDRENLGNPDRLWLWLEENTKRDITAAVLSADSLLYGSLIGSRKHEYEEAVILYRAGMFEEYRKKHKKIPIYTFSSIMRTPRNGAASGYEEPDYYRNYGANIFRYTALVDKAEIEGISLRERKEMEFLRRLIPARAMSDWLNRREKNYRANEKLLELNQRKVFTSLILGRDDNAPYSQTHKEGRKLKIQGANTMAGIDEMGLMQICRAINDDLKITPHVAVRYNYGRAGDTIPSYSDEKISDSISAEISAMGARLTDENRADTIMLVNTKADGKTYEANTADNDIKPDNDTRYFADIVEEYVRKNKNIVVADVSYANGSDNALMELLNERDLLYKVSAYSGWNTATNTTGFALATGLLSRRMTPSIRRQILLRRYIEDWAYQANIRQIAAGMLEWQRGIGYYDELGDKADIMAGECEHQLTRFIERNMPGANIGDKLRVAFPWRRMFEVRIYFDK